MRNLLGIGYKVSYGRMRRAAHRVAEKETGTCARVPETYIVTQRPLRGVDAIRSLRRKSSRLRKAWSGTDLAKPHAGAGASLLFSCGSDLAAQKPI